jgi:hypothetical protein
MKAREARANSEPKKKKFVAWDMCSDGKHKWLPDGTCNFCTQKRIPSNEEYMYR